MTGDLYNLNILVKLRGLLYQILINLAIAGTAEAILIQISAEKVPSSHRVTPEYLKLVTTSNFRPFSLR